MRIHRSAFLAAALLVPLTACSSGSSTGSDAGGDSAETSPITAAADPSLLPYNFLGDDNSTWEGINVDLGAALSEKLGRTVEFTSAGFDTIIPGLQSGRYDIALTGMFDTLERQKTVDFVDYLKAENNFVTRSDFRDVASMDDLCGEKVGIPGGALEADLLTDASKACTDAGKSAIQVSEFADLDAVVLALKSKRIDVSPNDSAANAYILSQNEGAMKTSGGYLNEGYFAAAFPKDSELTTRFQTAFDELITDGTYAEILDKWGISSRAMDKTSVNGATF
ncbi:ABC transporter substrate-binding protein [Kineosporia succinea]|uniref:Polar amino acid transport system substrate-binding protein n=1 Tax=Kineosporia succinea TaxID=84632 RepID=A0ABT9PDX7_9ACTN|nr:ABC transporter substrate-binding protein [Kineosporia succinea]MDP9830917.1 polar amino acid transport system substrate-binding protein [Kineosporia succinea]